jgi:hypothetical protein
MTQPELIDPLADDWAARFGLRRNASLQPGTSLQPLFTSTNLELVTAASAAHYGDDLLANSRAFKAIGALRDSVLVSAPLEETLLRAVGKAPRIVDEAWRLADAVGLRVRIGDPRDAILRGPSPVLPIVWWDPERISLPYAPLG